MASIEELSIDIVSNLGNADKALDRLSTSLSRMSATLGGLDTGKFSSIGNGVGNLAASMKNMSGVKSTDFNRVASGIGKLNNVDTSNLYNVGKGLSNLMVGFQGISAIVAGADRLSTAAGSIGKMGGAKVQAAITNMENVGPAVAALNSAFSDGLAPLPNITDFVSSISKLGGKSATSAIANLPALTDALSNTMKSLSSAPHVSRNVISLTNALADLASQGSKARGAANGLSAAMDRAGNSGKRASGGVMSFGFAVKSLLGAAGIAFGIREIARFGKSCINLGSAMTETQNVVDVAFGNMASKANAFAQTTDKKFGVSELSAKKYSGVLMSMYKSLGVNQADSAKMAMSLTGRSGDIASFYNIDTDQAFYKIRSAVSGETEPMKQLGVNMNVANLNAFALANGFGKVYDKMTLAEQAMLRFQYMMSATDQTAGDFVRTQNSFANQLRILQLNFQQFSSTMGQGFINVIVHVIRSLNTLMAYLQTAANAFRSFTALIFGDNSAQAGGGIAGDIEDASSSADGLANNLGGAAKAAKDLKNATTGIDELNVINPQTDSGSGGGAGGGGADVDYGQLNNGTSFVDDLNGKFSEMLRLLEPTTQALQKLWDEGFSKLKTFTFGTLKDFLDKFLKPVGLWTLSEAGLPRFINLTNDLLNRINWTRLKESLAGFYEQLGNLTILSFETLLDFYEGFLVPVAAWTIGDAIPRLLDVLTNLARSINWDGFVNSLSRFYQALSHFTIGVGDGLIAFGEGISRVLTPLLAGTVDLVSLAINGLSKIILAIPESTLTMLAGAMAGFLTVFVTHQAVTGIINTLELAITGLYVALDDFFKKAVVWVASNPYVALAAGIGAIAGALLTMEQNWNKQMADEFAQFQKDIGSNNQQMQEAAKALDDVAMSSRNVVANADYDAKQLRILSEAYFELADQTDLTAKQQNELRQYAQKLIDKCPELKKNIDMTTGRYTAQKDEIEKVIKKQQEYIMVMAYSQVVSDYARALADANVQLAASKQKCEDNAKAVEILEGKMEDLVHFVGNGGEESVWLENNREALEKFNFKIEEGEKASHALAHTISDYNEEIRKAKDSQVELQEAVDNANIAYNTATTELDKQQKAYNSLAGEIEKVDFHSIAEKAAKAIDDLGGVFVNGKQVVGPEAIALYQEILGSYKTIDQDMYNLGERGIVQFGVGGRAGIEAAIPTMTDELWSRIEEDYNSKGYTVAYDGGKVVVTGIADGGKELAPIAADEICDSVVDEVGSPETQQKFNDAGKQSGDSFAGGVVGTKQTNYAAGKSVTSSAIEGGNAGIEENLSSTSIPIQKWANLIIEHFTGIPFGAINAGTFKKQSDEMVDGFNKETTTKQAESKVPMENWAKSDREWFTGKDENQGVNEVSWSKYAENIIKAFNDKINSGNRDSQIPMENWAKNVRGWFWGDANIAGTGGMYQAFYEMSKRINEGFANGITNFAYMAKNAIRQWAEDVMDEAEEEFEINSPSKRFARMADFDLQGFNNRFAEKGRETQYIIDKWTKSLKVPEIGFRFNLGNDLENYVPNYGQNLDLGYGDIVSRVNSQVNVSANVRDNAVVNALMPYIQKLDKLDKLDSLENLDTMPEQRELLQEIAAKDTAINMNGRRVSDEMERTSRRRGYSFKPA